MALASTWRWHPSLFLLFYLAICSIKSYGNSFRRVYMHSTTTFLKTMRQFLQEINWQLLLGFLLKTFRYSSDSFFRKSHRNSCKHFWMSAEKIFLTNSLEFLPKILSWITPVNCLDFNYFFGGEWLSVKTSIINK